MLNLHLISYLENVVPGMLLSASSPITFMYTCVNTSLIVPFHPSLQYCCLRDGDYVPSVSQHAWGVDHLGSW